MANVMKLGTNGETKSIALTIIRSVAAVIIAVIASIVFISVFAPTTDFLPILNTVFQALPPLLVPLITIVGVIVAKSALEVKAAVVEVTAVSAEAAGVKTQVADVKAAVGEMTVNMDGKLHELTAALLANTAAQARLEENEKARVLAAINTKLNIETAKAAADQLIEVALQVPTTVDSTVPDTTGDLTAIIPIPGATDPSTAVATLPAVAEATVKIKATDTPAEKGEKEGTDATS